MSAKQKDVGSSPAHDQKMFFGFVGLFFANFFKCLQRVPLHFFAKEWMFKNSQRPPFTFFGTMQLTGDKKNRKKIRKNSKNSDYFFNFFPHAGTVEENT